MGGGSRRFLDWTRAQESPREPQVYDARFELNHALFDRYHLITGDAIRRAAFVVSGGAAPLPNTRVRLVPGVAGARERLTGDHAFHRGASAVLTRGAFNINSVSEAAWRAVLASSEGRGPDGAHAPGAPASFPRSARGQVVTSAIRTNFRDPKFWNNPRALSPAEIERLAHAVVVEIQRRGPSASLSDFVNRRLVPGEVSCDPDSPSPNACGALQAAIDRSGINKGAPGLVIARAAALPGTRHAAAQAAWVNTEGAAARLSQADVLRALGPVMAARSDTFRLRVLAETLDDDGRAARVTMEAVVQRLPAPLVPSVSHPDEPSAATAGLFGRRLVILRVRELR
jgi:hypothetical protein